MLVPAKLNLYLHITGKRPDGYHTLDSLIVFTDICDEINITPAPLFSLDISGEFANLVEKNERNIVTRAFRVMQEECNRPDNIAIKLIKNIPVGAGLGGGSGDAAATLMILNELWQAGFSKEKLGTIGIKLGADVPIFINQHAAFISGIGEKLQNTQDLPELYAVLVYPKKPLATQEVFGRTKISSYKKHTAPQNGIAILSFLKQQSNDLESAAISLLPEIKTTTHILGQAEGIEFARMSGSGSTCFGIFCDQNIAQNALLEMEKAHPEHWVRLVKIREQY